MLNSEKYKTAEERAKAFQVYCAVPKLKKHLSCIECQFAWLDLEAEEEKPLPCPICGCAVDIRKIGDYHTRSQVQCTCGYRCAWCDSGDEAIAQHNRVARAVMEAGKKE